MNLEFSFKRESLILPGPPSPRPLLWALGSQKGLQGGRWRWRPASLVGLLLHPPALLPPGSLGPAGSLQSEHHLYQLEASLAGLEQKGGGTERAQARLGEAFQREGAGPASRACCAARGSSLCALICSILNCLQFPSWGREEGRGWRGGIGNELGDSEVDGKPEAGRQSCVEFWGTGILGYGNSGAQAKESEASWEERWQAVWLGFGVPWGAGGRG